MTFEQAVTLLEIAVTELRENYSLLGFRDERGGKTALHIGSQAIFEALPAEAKLDGKEGRYEHYYKEVGDVRYICLYGKQNTE